KHRPVPDPLLPLRAPARVRETRAFGGLRAMARKRCRLTSNGRGDPDALRLSGLRRSLTPQGGEALATVRRTNGAACLEAKGGPGCASLTRATQKPHAQGGEALATVRRTNGAALP